MTNAAADAVPDVGPFLHIALAWADGPDVVPDGTPGAVRLHGHLYDGPAPRCPTGWWRPGRPTPPAASTTRASAASAGRPPVRRGVGRADGEARRRRVAGRRPQAPHVDVSVFARGLLDRVVTRIYFADETEANSADPVLSSVPAARRGTLLAVPDDTGYRFDIHLQGEAETVFFDL